MRTLQSLLAAERTAYVDVHHIAPRSEGGEHSRGNCVCLCTTHHALLHEGRLRIEGDADGELRFHDATGALLCSPVASHVGTAAAPVGSHVGTAAGAGAGEEAAAVLALMGGRGGWSVDLLVDASGLPVGAVQYALMSLELDGRVASDAFGSYAPCTPCGPHPR